MQGCYAQNRNDIVRAALANDAFGYIVKTPVQRVLSCSFCEEKHYIMITLSNQDASILQYLRKGEVELCGRVMEAAREEESKILLRLKVGQAGVVRRLAQVPWKLVKVGNEHWDRLISGRDFNASNKFNSFISLIFSNQSYVL